MTCPACDADALRGMFMADCHGCKIRALAGGPQHFEARRDGRVTKAYADAIRKVFGKGADVPAIHMEVKAAAERAKQRNPQA